MPILILSLLFLATAIYAVILEHRTWSLYDWVWMETVIGCSICLASVAVAAQYDPALWPGLIAAGWAFLVGGLPIVIWSVWRMIKMRDQKIEYLEQGKRHDTTTSLAADSGRGETSRD